MQIAGEVRCLKKIEAIIRPDKLNEIKNALARVGARGMTISEVVGCGLQKGQTGVYRGHVYDITLLPKVKLEIVLLDELVEQVVAVILEYGRTGNVGDGKIFVYPVEEVYRIRSGDKGKHAL
jgi:nitrogen regulatory protein PII